jgi:site-specific recombinase XerC
MTAARKKAPPRPGKPVAPTCDHCGKPCGTTIVRAASGVYCGTKHRRAREALLAAALEPAPVDVAEVMTQALARREVHPRPEVYVAAAPTPAGQRVLAKWIGNKSPDTVRSYKASARHFVAWARLHGHVRRETDLVRAVVEAFTRPKDEGNDMAGEWLGSQFGLNPASIATRCSGLRKLCTVLEAAGMIGYVPLLERPAKLRRTAMESFVRFHGVPEAFAAIVDGLEQLARPKAAKPIDVRDWAMLRTAGGLGLRRIELVRLDVASLDFDSGSLMVHGKGRPAPVAFPMPAKSLQPVMRRWLAVRTAAIGPSGPLFPVMGPRPPAGKRMERGGINAMIFRRAREFGVKLSPHDLRRVFCTAAIERLGMRLAKGITRHVDESTLALYDMSAGREMVEMVSDVGDDVQRNVRNTVKKGKQR